MNYYFKYQVFPSEYVRYCIVTLLSQQNVSGTSIPESYIHTLDLSCASDIKHQLSEVELQISPRIKQQQLNTTRSGCEFKNTLKYREPTIIKIEQLFRKAKQKTEKAY